MKKVLRMICVSIVLSLVLLCVPVSASENQDIASSFLTNEVIAKLEFVSKMDAKFAEDSKNGLIKSFDKDSVNQLREEYAFALTDEQKEYYLSELEKYGVYIFNDGQAVSQNTLTVSHLNSIHATPTPQPADIHVNTPTVFYDSVVKEWTVTCSGSWKNNNYNTITSDTGNVGGFNGFGVGYTVISGTYRTYVKSAYGYFEDQYGMNRVTVTNRSDGDGTKGFGFRIQDRIAYNSNAQKGYIGYKWYGACTYDQYFSYYSCNITGYYAHTYSQTVISSISFGIQDEIAGISIGFSSENKGFDQYSADYRWGV